MLNYVWFGLLVIGFTVGILNGRADEVSQAVMNSSKNAVELSIGLMGVLCLWTGLMNIAQKSGLVGGLARWVRPVMRFLFPGIPKKHPAMGAMVMNLTANFFGLGNAATPLGIKAMHELQKVNGHQAIASDAMSMFLVLNTAAIQLIPANIIALRTAAGSSNPGEIIVTIWFATLCATITGIGAAKFFSKVWRDKHFL